MRTNLLCTLLLLLAGCAEAPPLPAARSVPTTRWMQPTPRPPVDTAMPPTNLSSLPGVDTAPQIAVHPRDGWAALVWAHTPLGGGGATVYVKVQDPRSRQWQPGTALSTATAAESAGHPAVAIDAAGRVHVIFGQGRLRPHYTVSDDGGRTWAAPAPLPIAYGASGAIFGSLIVQDDLLHVLLVAGPDGCDCARAYHLQRPLAGGAWTVEAPIVPGAKHLRVDQVALADGRLLAVVACVDGCGQPSRAIVGIRARGGGWTTRRIGGAAGPADGVVDWVSAAQVPGGACVAWGTYARSDNFSSCSFDGGGSWEDAKPIVETPARAVPDSDDTGATPALLYVPETRTLVAVQLYRQAGDPTTIYPIYSYRRLEWDHWAPDLAGPFAHHQPALRLFPATPRSYADPGMNTGIHVARGAAGLAWATWAEVQHGESADVFAAQFNPAALTAEDHP